jgi:NAD(P)H-flavin reductase
MTGNPFVPHAATIKAVTDLTPDVKLFNVEINDPTARAAFSYKPGQFAFLSAFGQGEGPFGICSLASRGAGVEFAIRKVGTVTAALHELEVGAQVGLRGPMGNWFPVELYKGKHIYIVGGGIGFAPLRPVVHHVLDNRKDYGDLVIINGARTPADLTCSNEFDEWSKSSCTRLELTVDKQFEGWEGRVALIPDVITELKLSPKDAVAIVCGPPIMIKFALARLKTLGFGDDQIVTTLEQKMKCGIGKCARCNVGFCYICKDGPVFTFAQIAKFIEQM